MGNINITELGIADLTILVTSVIAVITGSVSLIWLVKNWIVYLKKERLAICREKQSLFDIRQYADNIDIAVVSRKQDNQGPNPETFNRDISFINYFEDIDFGGAEADTGEKRGVV